MHQVIQLHDDATRTGRMTIRLEKNQSQLALKMDTFGNIPEPRAANLL